MNPTTRKKTMRTLIADIAIKAAGVFAVLGTASLFAAVILMEDETYATGSQIVGVVGVLSLLAVPISLLVVWVAEKGMSELHKIS